MHRWKCILLILGHFFCNIKGNRLIFDILFNVHLYSRFMLYLLNLKHGLLGYGCWYLPLHHDCLRSLIGLVLYIHLLILLNLVCIRRTGVYLSNVHHLLLGVLGILYLALFIFRKCRSIYVKLNYLTTLGPCDLIWLLTVLIHWRRILIQEILILRNIRCHVLFCLILLWLKVLVLLLLTSLNIVKRLVYKVVLLWYTRIVCTWRLEGLGVKIHRIHLLLLLLLLL